MKLDNIILWDTKYGRIHCDLKSLLDKKGITMYRLIRLTGLKYDVVKRYYEDTIIKYNADVLAKICYSLECDIDELLWYESDV